MPDSTTKTPVIRQGWLRVLLFCAAFGLLSIAISIPAILLLTGTSRDDLKGSFLTVPSNLLSGEYFWLMLVLEFVVSLICVVIFRLWIDRRSWNSLGWPLGNFTGEALTGLCLGPALLGLAALCMLFSGHLEWTDIVWDPTSLFISFGWMVLIAFSEELVFRGYILNNLMDSFGNKWVPLSISALLFTVYHFDNPGVHTLAFINVFLAGLLLGINYVYTRNLWFPFLLHLSWNFFQGPLLGFHVGGVNFPSLLQAQPNGDLFITGGDFGLEGSILNTAFTFVAVVILYWAFEKKYNNKTPLPSPSAKRPSSPARA